VPVKALAPTFLLAFLDAFASVCLGPFANYFGHEEDVR